MKTIRRSKNKFVLTSHLLEVPGQRPARVGQGPVVVHLGGVAGEVRSLAAVRLGRREINVLASGGSIVVVGPTGVHLLQPPERHVGAGCFSSSQLTGGLPTPAAPAEMLLLPVVVVMRVCACQRGSEPQ